MDTDNPHNFLAIEKINLAASKTANLEAMLESPAQFWVQGYLLLAKIKESIKDKKTHGNVKLVFEYT